MQDPCVNVKRLCTDTLLIFIIILQLVIIRVTEALLNVILTKTTSHKSFRIMETAENVAPGVIEVPNCWLRIVPGVDPFGGDARVLQLGETATMVISLNNQQGNTMCINPLSKKRTNSLLLNHLSLFSSKENKLSYICTRLEVKL